MKLTAIILLTVSLHVAARSEGQTVTLKEKNATLEKILVEIRKQTGYNFFFADGALKNAKRVTIEVNNVPVKQALEICFKDQPLNFAIEGSTIVVKPEPKKNSSEPLLDISSPETDAKQIDVTGRVLSEKGVPVSGVTITIKGTNTITTTNSNGEFSLKSVDPDAILVFTHVSMETFELKVSGKTDLAINLKTKISSLGDVTVTVNTGYQQLPKERATGSFGFVNNQELNRKSGADVLGRIEGVTTGIIFDRRRLTPHQTGINQKNLLIRGVSTMSEGFGSPLIVVDNFIYDGDINNINPNDVESITILKDAAAASIWGAKAGNGVIVITTKRGQYNQPLRLSLNSNIQIMSEPNLFANPKMSTSEFIEVEQFLFDKGRYNGALNSSLYTPVSPVVEILAKKRAGVISDQQAAQQISELQAYDVRSDFERYVYHKGVNTQYALNISGGNEKVKYFVSGGYDKSLSTLIGNNSDRITLRTSSSFMPVKNLDVNLGITYTNTSAKNNSLGDIGSPNYGFSSGFVAPYTRFADKSGNALQIARDFRIGFTDTAGAGRLLDWAYRPLDEMRNSDNKSRLSDIVINFGLSYQLTSFLAISTSYQYENSKSETRSLYSEATYFTRNLINRFTQINGATVTNILPMGGILDTDNSELISHTGRTQINLNKNWNNVHNVIGIIGAEIREIKGMRETKRFYGFNPDRYTLASVDYTNFYPQYPTGDAQITDPSGLAQSKNRFVSIYGNLAYSYKSRYIVSASARKDAANLFGVKSNNRWKPLWTTGAAWHLHKESFYKITWLSKLTLRATYGYQGNVNNSISPYTILAFQSSNNLANLPWATIINAANPQLQWESTGQLNLAVDFNIGQRFGGSVDVYRKKSNNLLWNMPIDPTTGVVNVKSNSATMVGRGLEVLLRTLNIKGKLEWSSEFGFSYNTNKVIDYLSMNNNITASAYATTTGLSIIGNRGKSPYSIYSYPFAGLDPNTGDPQGYLGKTVSTNYRAIFNQLYDTSNLVYHGSALPTYTGFFNQIVKYKAFSLFLNVNYRLGYYFRKNTISYFDLIFFGAQHPDYSRRWQQSGDEKSTTVPSLIYPTSNNRRDAFYAYSSANVHKGDHVRLQNVRLSYEFTRLAFKKAPFRSIQVYGNIENLGIIWRANNENLDPDYNTGNAVFPVPKMFTVGLNANF